MEKQVLWQRPWSCASHLIWDKEPTWLYPPYEILTNQEDRVDVPNSWNKSNFWQKMMYLDHESMASNVFPMHNEEWFDRELGHWVLRHPDRDHGNSNIFQYARPTNRSCRLQTIHIFNHIKPSINQSIHQSITHQQAYQPLSHPAWIEDRRNMKSSFSFSLCFPTRLGSFYHLRLQRVISWWRGGP